jgi:hypothetical protein
LPQSFFSTEQGTAAGRDATIPIVSESADPEDRKMAQLLSEAVMVTMQEGVHFEIVGVKVGSEAERSGSLMPACPCLVSVSSRTRECTRDSSCALKPQKPLAHF